MDVFSLDSYGKRRASKWLILCIIFSCADTEIYFRRLLPKRKVIWQMNHTAMNNSISHTDSQSFSDIWDLEVCHSMFDFCRHILLMMVLSAFFFSVKLSINISKNILLQYTIFKILQMVIISKRDYYAKIKMVVSKFRFFDSFNNSTRLSGSNIGKKRQRTQ